MSKKFIERPALNSLRRQLALSLEPWAHRGVVLTVNGKPFGEVDEIATARLIVDLHNHGLALVNEVVRLLDENRSVWRLNRELMLNDPDLQPRANRRG